MKVADGGDEDIEEFQASRVLAVAPQPDDDETVGPAATTVSWTPAWRDISHARMAGFSAFWLARSVYQAAIAVYLLQALVDVLVPDPLQVEAVFSASSLPAAFAGMFFNPMIGSMSDRWTTSNRFGRRIPFVVVGVLLHAVPLLAFAWLATFRGQSTSPQLGGFLLVVLSLNCVADAFADAVSMAPYSAVIPDYVPKFQFGAASGWMGLASMLGNLLGAAGTGLFLAYFDLAWMFVALIVVQLIGAALLVACNDPEQNAETYTHIVRTEAAHGARPSIQRGSSFVDDVRLVVDEFMQPFRRHNFGWVFFSRFAYNLGFNVLSSFFIYLLRDMVGAPFDFFGVTIESVALAMALFMLLFLVGSVSSSLLSGVLSDRHGRKPLVYVAVGLQCVATFVLLVSKNYTLLAGFMAPLAGAGYGSYVSVDWALASDAIIDSRDLARDMGIWHLSFSAPSVIGLPIAGFCISFFRPIGNEIGVSYLGHRIVLIFVIICYALGALFIYPIDFPKPHQPSIDDDDGTLARDTATDDASEELPGFGDSF